MTFINPARERRFPRRTKCNLRILTLEQNIVIEMQNLIMIIVIETCDVEKEENDGPVASRIAHRKNKTNKEKGQRGKGKKKRFRI